MQCWKIGSGALCIRQGDIATLEYDAIVNAANSRLAGGGGVDGAIHRAAGAEPLQEVCQAIIADIGSLPTGEAVITSGFNLPAKHIIHTVGPIWRDGDQHESQLLRAAYLNSLKLAQKHTIMTIAFPAISCGIYGYPVEQAARIALTALKEGLVMGMVKEASMVLHSETAFNLWNAVAKEVL